MLKIIPPAWLLFFLGIATAVHYLIPAARVFDIGNLYIGIALFVIALGVTQYASMLFAKEKTEIVPTSPANRALVTAGPFKYSRNPMYLGMVISLLGIAIAVGTLPFYLAALADFLVLNFVFIPFEEAKMLRQFGAEYEAYTQRVRRWI